MSRLEILDSHYGAAGSDKDMVDVTDLIRGKIWPSKEGISVLVSPSSIGISDPAPQSPKVLVVRYRIDGGAETKVSTPDAATFAVTVPGTAPKSTIGFAAELYLTSWNSILSAGLLFITVLSIVYVYRLGAAGYGITLFLLALAVLAPVWGFFTIILVVMIHSAISQTRVVTFQ